MPPAPLGIEDYVRAYTDAGITGLFRIGRYNVFESMVM